MIERLLETWLNKANERSFQYPFCYWLASQGYKVIHLSRHCGMEIGKDVLAIDPKGVPCAYQIKGVDGGKLTQKRWIKDVQAQIQRLTNTAIVHPSIPPDVPHRSYLVINGELEEEVFYEIQNFNKCQERDGYPNRKLNVIVKGELLDGFKRLQSDFWVDNLPETKTYLELLLESGKGQLPKDKLSQLIYAALPFNTDEGKRPNGRKIGRSLAGCAIICASAISSFTTEENHVAEFEAWTIYFSYTLALCERWGTPRKEIQFALDIATEGIYSSLDRLCEELLIREHLVVGNVLTDKFVYGVRLTRLLGLMGLFALWRKHRGTSRTSDSEVAKDGFLHDFSIKHRRSIDFWGEHAIPEIFSFYFYYRTIDPTQDRVDILFWVIQRILNLNGNGSGRLANPYYDAEQILPHISGLQSHPLRDSFSGSSYCLEAVLHLFVRLNYKQRTKQLFPPITKMIFHTLEYDKPWHLFFYRIEQDTGHRKSSMLVPPHSWTRFKADAHEGMGQSIPLTLKDHPFHYLCLINTFPHRLNSDGVRWIDTLLVDLGLG